MRVMGLIDPSSDQRLKKTFSIEGRAPLMLKDYLLDDFSSCSSNGFKSFPRRQCCTTVRFLLEIDLKKGKTSNYRKPSLTGSLSRSAASTTISALQRASGAVINAVKQLPFSSPKSPSSSLRNRARKGLLPRSFSRKLLKRSFWKKAREDDREIRRWRSFAELLEEEHQTFDQNPHDSATTTATTAATTTATIKFTSTSSWDEGGFLNSENSSENDTVEGEKELTKKKMISEIVAVTAGEDSESTVNNYHVENAKEWAKEGKEQFSPVSVLDCPFEDDEDFNSSFRCSLEGRKQKLKQKIRQFDSQPPIEPVDLEKRISLSELPCSISICKNIFDHDNEEEYGTKEQAEKLLNLIKARNPSNNVVGKEDNLLLDFFGEKTTENHCEKDLLKVAEDWINGESKELFVGWEAREARYAYVRDMEKNGRWKNMDEEREKVSGELELDFFTSLVDELLLDLL